MFVICLYFTIIFWLYDNHLYFWIFSSPSEKELQYHALTVAECVRNIEDTFVKELSNVSNKHLKHKDSFFETFVGYFSRKPHLHSRMFTLILRTQVILW